MTVRLRSQRTIENGFVRWRIMYGRRGSEIVYSIVINRDEVIMRQYIANELRRIRSELNQLREISSHAQAS